MYSCTTSLFSKAIALSLVIRFGEGDRSGQDFPHVGTGDVTGSAFYEVSVFRPLWRRAVLGATHALRVNLSSCDGPRVLIGGTMSLASILAQSKTRVVWTSFRRPVLDPATSLRAALDYVGWGRLCSGLALGRWLVGGSVQLCLGIPLAFGGVAVGRLLARRKVCAVGISCRRSVLDPATSLRCALDDVGWRVYAPV